MFTEWIRKQYAKLQELLPSSQLELLKLVSKYEGYKSPEDYLFYLLTQSLKPYEDDIRFERWLEKYGKTRGTEDTRGDV